MTTNKKNPIIVIELVVRTQFPLSKKYNNSDNKSGYASDWL